MAEARAQWANNLVIVNGVNCAAVRFYALRLGKVYAGMATTAIHSVVSFPANKYKSAVDHTICHN